MIEFHNVTHSYEKERISLSRFDAVFRDDAMTAVFGDNGAGKSTVAMLANGLIKPDAGSVRVDGLDTSNTDALSEIRRKVGLVFQNPDSQFVATTVEKEIAFGLENLGIPGEQIRKAVEETLELFGISHLKGRSPRDLSEGEKGIVAIASVLALKPKYLMLDEPTSHLDTHEAGKIWSIIGGLKGKHSIILITQERSEIERCDQVIALSFGGKVYDGPVKDFLGTVRVSSDLTVLAQELISQGVDVPAGSESIDEFVDSILQRRTRERSARDGRASMMVSPAGSDSWFETIGLADASYVYNRGLPGETTGISRTTVELKKGEFMGIVGPNGSGKTTLSLLLAGLLKPASGGLMVNGRNAGELDDPARLRRQIGFVFQNPERAFFTDSCADEVLFGLKNFRVEGAEEKAASSLDFAGLPYREFGVRSPFEISCGEQRRLAIACSLAYEPSIVFFDEPTAGLDQKGKDFIRELLARVKASGRTVVLVSHDSGLVLDLSDRVIGLDKGSVVYSGSPDEVGRSELAERLELKKSDVHNVLVLLKSKGLDVDTEIFSPRRAALAISQLIANSQ